MPYDVTLRDLFNNCLADRSSRLESKESRRLRAVAWVEALNVRETWRLVQRWFEMIESGEATHRYPDPVWDSGGLPGREPLTPELADKIIADLDGDLMIEVTRLRNVDPDLQGSDFARLPAHARMSFVQDLCRTMRTARELEAEAERRIREGETIPPVEGDPLWQER